MCCCTPASGKIMKNELENSCLDLIFEMLGSSALSIAVNQIFGTFSPPASYILIILHFFIHTF
jgi:hypothetical protein